MPLLKQQLSSMPGSEEFLFAFPDDGAYKRFHLLFPDDDKLIICAKKRMEGNKRVVTIKDGKREKWMPSVGVLSCAFILLFSAVLFF